MVNLLLAGKTESKVRGYFPKNRSGSSPLSQFFLCFWLDPKAPKDQVPRKVAEAVRSGGPRACQVRTQPNNHRCAKRITSSGIAPEEESDRTAVRALGAGVKTTGSRRVQRPLADFAEPPQSKRRNPLRCKSGVFCARSVSAGVVTRCFSPCLIFWCFWIKTKAQEERKCTTEEIDSPERIPTSRSAASYLRAEGRGTRPRWRASAGGDFNPHGAKVRNISSRIVGFRKAETWPARHVAP